MGYKPFGQSREVHFIVSDFSGQERQIQDQLTGDTVDAVGISTYLNLSDGDKSASTVNLVRTVDTSTCLTPSNEDLGAETGPFRCGIPCNLGQMACLWASHWSALAMATNADNTPQIQPAVAV